jgi:glycosyltransferase involved in cell wall biosynthesis
MKIWLFQTGEPLHSDQNNPRPMRVMNLANKLIESGHNVVVWSSAFHHQSKTHRSISYQCIKISDHLEIRLIPSPGYKNNISFSRFYDHLILAKNFQKYLRYSKDIPDVAFVGYPPIEVAYFVSCWLKQQKIPFLIDVKDQWPDIIVNSFPEKIRFFAKILLFPYYVLAKKSMYNATGICAHTEGFVDWASKFSNKKNLKYNFIAPLTAPKYSIDCEENISAINWWAEQGIIKTTQLRVIFIGSFSRAFDFDAIFSTATELQMKKIPCEFLLCGDGERYDELSLLASKLNNVSIIDWIDQPKITALSNMSNFMIAPYKSTGDFTMSIPNKIIDSFALGLPVLSSLSGEVASILNKKNVGLTYSDNTTLFKCIEEVLKNPEMQILMSKNATNLYESEFDFDKKYNDLVIHLQNIKLNKQ